MQTDPGSSYNVSIQFTTQCKQILDLHTMYQYSSPHNANRSWIFIQCINTVHHTMQTDPGSSYNASVQFTTQCKQILDLHTMHQYSSPHNANRSWIFIQCISTVHHTMQTDPGSSYNASVQFTTQCKQILDL